MSTEEGWETWRDRLRGESGEDLVDVLTSGRTDLERRSSRSQWANDDRTRQYLDLGLHFIYRHHIIRDQLSGTNRDEEVLLFRFPTGERLERHASEVILDQQLARRLNEDKWKRNWRYLWRYRADLLAYLFRPAIYMRQIRATQRELLETASTHPVALGPFMDAAADQVVEQVATDPIVTLQTFMQAALPSNQAIRGHVTELETQALGEWALTYERLFGLFDVGLRPDRTWHDLAETLSTLAEGAVLRRRTLGRAPKLSNGESVFADGVRSTLVRVLDLTVADLDTRMPKSHSSAE